MLDAQHAFCPHAIVEFENEDDLKVAAKAMRFFELVQGIHSRGLAFTAEHFLSNEEKLARTLYVERIPEGLLPKDFHAFFSMFGEVTMARIMLTRDLKLRQNGRVRYADAESKQRAI